MFEKRYYGAKIELSAPIVNPKFMDNLLMRTEKVTIQYDFTAIKAIHPKMDPLNYHESILARALKGDEKESQCIHVTGDVTVLAKLVGVKVATAIMDVQRLKAEVAAEDAKENPGYTAKATEAIRNMFSRKTEAAGESTDSADTPPSEGPSDTKEDGQPAGATA